MIGVNSASGVKMEAGHSWIKSSWKYGTKTEEEIFQIIKYLSTSTEIVNVYYGTSIEIKNDLIYIKSPSIIAVNYDSLFASDTITKTLRGKYLWLNMDHGKVIYYNASDSNVTASINEGKYIVALTKASKVSMIQVADSKIGYIISNDVSKYPDDGYADGFYYVKQG